jgi:hypothetical protein
MDAPPLSSERKRELAALRSRAYGPDADIDGDVDALARLIELEELARAGASDTVADLRRGRVSTPSKAAATAASVDGASPAVVLDEAGDPVSAVTPPAASGLSRWGRRVPPWAYILGASAVGLAVGLAAPAIVTPRPATTLQQAPFDGTPLDFEMYGIQALSPVRYEPYHGLEVWSSRTEQGSTCVVVTTPSGEWMTAGCAPEPLSPTADVNFSAGMRPIDGLDLPAGSIVRFALRGDVMEVWIAETVESA